MGGRGIAASSGEMSPIQQARGGEWEMDAPASGLHHLLAEEAIQPSSLSASETVRGPRARLCY